MPDDAEFAPLCHGGRNSHASQENAQMTFFPWKEPQDRVAVAVRHLRTFLTANTPA